MKIVTDKNNIDYGTAVALGNFDGIHLGHKKLIDKVVSISKERKITPSVFTFESSFNEFKLHDKDNLIVSEKQKEAILEDLGVELIYKVKFSEDIRKMTPEEFIKDIIIDKLNAKLLIVGFNFMFGYKAEGNIRVLSELSNKYNFELIVIDPIDIDGCIVSSTIIREYIKNGKINCANEMLGREYSIIGEVISGKGRGKKLGFATANLKCDADYIPPRDGVYRTTALYDGKEYKSITNIGSNPTFDDVGFSIETHILDFSKSIYGEKIEIKFLDFLRPEVKFETVEKLVEQVNSDIRAVVEWE